MNETRQPQGEPLRTEVRIVRGAMHGMRQDLFVRAFAFRPLPPLDAQRVAGWAPWLPPRIVAYLRWTPHAFVLFFAACVFLVMSLAANGFSPVGGLALMIFGLLVAGSVVMTLLRPVGAFWLSLLGLCLGMVGGDNWQIAFVAHMITMVLVVFRTRPRLALELWLVTFAVLGFATTILSVVGSAFALPLLAVMSAIVLLAAAAVRAWRQERQVVVETRTVTAEERSRRTLLEERANIARELHDVVAHHMSVIAIQAEAAPYRVQDTPPELATAFSTIRENAVAALTELRRILGVVRSDDPDAFSDPEAPQPTLADLDGLLTSVRSAGLEAEAVVTGAKRPLPQGVELSAYRIIQEALSNTLRHAPGAQARVEVAYVLGGLGLRIVNGPPNRLAKPSPGAGHGVLGMHERVGMLSGEMTNGPTDEGGYEVTVFLPVATTTLDAPAAQDAPTPRSTSAAQNASPPRTTSAVQDASPPPSTLAAQDVAAARNASADSNASTGPDVPAAPSNSTAPSDPTTPMHWVNPARRPSSHDRTAEGHDS